MQRVEPPKVIQHFSSSIWALKSLPSGWARTACDIPTAQRAALLSGTTHGGGRQPIPACPASRCRLPDLRWQQLRHRRAAASPVRGPSMPCASISATGSRTAWNSAQLLATPEESPPLRARLRCRTVEPTKEAMGFPTIRGGKHPQLHHAGAGLRLGHEFDQRHLGRADQLASARRRVIRMLAGVDGDDGEMGNVPVVLRDAPRVPTSAGTSLPAFFGLSMRARSATTWAAWCRSPDRLAACRQQRSAPVAGALRHHAGYVDAVRAGDNAMSQGFAFRRTPRSHHTRPTQAACW